MLKSKIKLRSFCVTAIMGAIGFVLMLIEISVPFMPFFIKLDFSELPALITAFALGPVYGVIVCLIKNLLHMFVSSTLCIGELANFLMGVFFSATAGLVYRFNKTRKGAFIAALTGAFAMAVSSVFINYFISYPLYSVFLMPKEVILSAYQTILPTTSNLFEALIIFNLPFTFLKGILDAVICFIVYKKLSPILKK